MTAEGDDWFAFTWQGADAADLVFNDGAGRQTGNLRRERDGWFFTGNTWYDENPERPQIPVVRASPRGGLYNRAQQVTLEGSNDDDSFFYTLDGTEPTTASPRYAGPISLDRTATLSVIGVNSAGEQGQIRTFTYTIDSG